MPQDRFLIAPLNSGLQRNVKPWLIMDDAFFRLRNAYNWRGSVKKRFGAVVMNGSVSDVQKPLFTRLRINLGTTDGNGDLAGNVPGVIRKVGQLFSCGDEIFTVNVLGAPAVMLTTGAATVHTFNTTTGAFDIQGSTATTAVFFYPSEPVMHLGTYNIAAINDEQLIAFDTQFAYEFVFANGWDILGPIPPAANSAVWTGGNADFHITSNYRGLSSTDFIFFVTNDTPADGIKVWNGAPGALTWTTLPATVLGTTNPVAQNFIETCRIIIPFQDRLILLNVSETVNNVPNQRFANRIRFCQAFGDPTANDVWRTDIVAAGTDGVGKGGFVEANIKEAITGAQILKDRLIVFFEASTWELVYTGNPSDAFRLQRLDTELGVESTHSLVYFDKAILGMGQKGVHACNGMNVERIDELIPLEVFGITNADNGPQRVQGIRDYFTELVYWTYRSNRAQQPTTDVYPNQVLVYNYENRTWSLNDDCITAFGNFHLQRTLVWQDIARPWRDMDEVWNDPSFISEFRTVIAGNQEGFTFRVNATSNKNSPALQITNIVVAGNQATITCIEHTIPNNSFIFLDNIQGTGTLAAVLNRNIYKVRVTNNNTIVIADTNLAAATYNGGGTIRRVSQVDIITKSYSFYDKEGLNMYIPRIEFYIDRMPQGVMAIEMVASSAIPILLLATQPSTGTTLGSPAINLTAEPSIPLEAFQNRVWRTIYPYAEGESIQIRLFYNETRMTDPTVVFAGFELNAMLFYVNKSHQF